MGSAFNPFAGAGAAISTFLALTDVSPSTYVGEALKGVRVNAGETALEFFSLVLSGDNSQITDVILEWNNAAVNAASPYLLKLQSGNPSTVWGIVDTSGRISIGDTPTIDSAVRLLVREADNIPTANHLVTENILTLTFSGAATTTDDFFKVGNYGAVTFEGAGTWTYANINGRNSIGVWGDAVQNGSAESEVEWLIGVRGRAITISAGNVGFGIGVYGDVVASGAATGDFNTGASFYGTMDENAGAAVMDYYGLYLEGKERLGGSNDPATWTGIYMNAKLITTGIMYFAEIEDDVTPNLIDTSARTTDAVRNLPVNDNGTTRYIRLWDT